MKISSNSHITTALIILVLSVLFSAGYAKACSAFTIEQNNRVVAAKSYDWNTGLGLILSNPRGQRQSIPTGVDAPISWDARFGSITFNQYGRHLPNGGINEAGLVIEVLWLEDTYYPEDESKIPINELQWVQYHLDVCQTVDDVIKSSRNFNIIPIFGKLHYYIADKNGNTAIIDFVNGEAVIHSGDNLNIKAITNDTYSNSIKYMENNEKKGGKSASLNRFVRIAESLQNINQTKNSNECIIDTGFNILESVWVNNWTKWNIVYDLNNKKIYYKTNKSLAIKEIKLQNFNFNPNAVPLHVNLNNFYTGNIYDYFIPFSNDINYELKVNSLGLTGVPLEKDEIKLITSYINKTDSVNNYMIERINNHGTLVVKIEGLKSSEGYINLGLFDSEDGFDNHRPINGGRFKAVDDTNVYVFYNVPKNKHYAIGFFQDINYNRTLDTNFLGLPREPYGFSNNSRRFESAKFYFDKQVKKIIINPR